MVKITPYEVEWLIKNYGDVKLSELSEKLKHGKNHKCPKCEGKGFIIKMIDVYPMGLPDSGWVNDWKEVKNSCDLCNGLGYTHKQYKPKVETKIIGYELED